MQGKETELVNIGRKCLKQISLKHILKLFEPTKTLYTKKIQKNLFIRLLTIHLQGKQLVNNY